MYRSSFFLPLFREQKEEKKKKVLARTAFSPLRHSGVKGQLYRHATYPVRALSPQ